MTDAREAGETAEDKPRDDRPIITRHTWQLIAILMLAAAAGLGLGDLANAVSTRNGDAGYGAGMACIALAVGHLVVAVVRYRRRR
jgi:hypothetical protein